MDVPAGYSALSTFVLILFDFLFWSLYSVPTSTTENTVPKKKTTAEFIADAMAIHGENYAYTKVQYVNQLTPVEIICHTHGSFWQKPVFHTANRAGCPKCAGNDRLTLEVFLADARGVHGDRYKYDLVKIASNTSPVKIRCPDHGVFEQTPKQHRKGRGCPKCGGTEQLTQTAVLEKFRAAHGPRYDYGKVQYLRAAAEVVIVCPIHGDFAQRAAVHWSGHGCPKCAKASTASTLRTPDATRVAQLDALGHGYTYDVSTAKNNKELITITCDKGHTFEQIMGSAFRFKCPTCAKRNSKGEQELRAFIAALGVPVFTSRKIAPPKEIDAWCPKHNVGFEFNGLFYHSDAFPDAQLRHKSKSDAVRAAGGELVHIWEDEWADRRTAVEHMIRAKLGVLDRVWGRKCEARKVEKPAAKDFVNTYHLQGWVPAEYLGLYFAGSLVAVMGFAVARSVRGNTDQGLWELVRYAAKVRVVGGAGKLLAAWQRTAESWHTLITYCDLAQFQGGLYTALGFTEVKRSRPDYKIVRAGSIQRLHKSTAKKASLARLLGARYDAAKTEAQLCAENHIFRIWGCGTVKYELRRGVPTA